MTVCNAGKNDSVSPKSTVEPARPRAATKWPAFVTATERPEGEPSPLCKARIHLSLCAYHTLRNPDDRDDRHNPRREKGNRHADHAQAPHDCAGALRKRTSQRREQSALLRNDTALAVNLDRDVSGRAGFVGL